MTTSDIPVDMSTVPKDYSLGQSKPTNFFLAKPIFWHKPEFRFELAGFKNVRKWIQSNFPMPFWLCKIFGRKNDNYFYSSVTADILSSLKAVLDTPQCHWYFWTAHTAAFPDSPIK